MFHVMPAYVSIPGHAVQVYRTYVVQSSSNTNHWENLLLLYDRTPPTMLHFGDFSITSTAKMYFFN